MIKTIAKLKTTLAGGISTTSTTMELVSNVSNDNEAIANGLYGFVIDEGNANEEYVIGTLSSLTVTFTVRGVSYEDGKTAINANKKAHRRGASIKITDHPALRQIIDILNGDVTITNAIKSSHTPTADEDLANKEYVDSVVIAGGTDASTSNKGIAKLSSAPVSATEPIAVGDNDPRVPTADEKAAMAGSVGEPSASNKFLTEEDADEAATDSSLVRRDSNGDVIVPSTPSSDNGAISKGYLETTGGKYYTLTASDELKASADNEQSTGAGSMTKLKEIKIRFEGTLRVKFDLKEERNGQPTGEARARIYKNGIAVGTERTNSTSAYQIFTEDISVTKEDLVQLYVSESTGGVSGRLAYARNFRLHYNKGVSNDYVINQN
jgi:hypothetical protein